jgi:RimJ/RimL family protein N-acetyltransferase
MSLVMPTETIEQPTSAPSNGAAPVEPGRGSEGQTFLIGENLYLRAFELGDAKHHRAWRDSPFPITAERAEELLKKQIPEDHKERRQRLLVLRRADDAPVGSISYRRWDMLSADLSTYVNPAFGPETVDTLRAEILEIVVPWLLEERDIVTIWLELTDGEPVTLATLSRLGLREAARYREADWRDGRRVDHLTFQAFHPAWIARLGDPTVGDAALRERFAAQRAEFAGRSPGTRHRIGPVPFAGGAEPPKNAVMVGERIYLRPAEIEDAEEESRWSRRETETFFDDGRIARSPISMAHWTRELAEADHPEWIRFAICLRDGDVNIGSNGIGDIDWIKRTAETESFIFRADYRGGGYGTEAKHLLLAYAFDVLGFHAVRSYVWGPNTRSAAALRKQGYQDAGIFHWSGIKNGELSFDVTFDLLASEWRAMRDAANG